MDYSIAKPKSLTFLESGASILWEQSQAERGRPLSTDRKSFINVTLSAPPGADRLLDRWPFSPPTGVGHNIEEFDSLGSDNDIFFASNWQSLSLTWQKSSPFRRCRSRTHAAHTSHGPPSGETFPKTCCCEESCRVRVRPAGAFNRANAQHKPFVSGVGKAITDGATLESERSDSTRTCWIARPHIWREHPAAACFTLILSNSTTPPYLNLSSSLRISPPLHSSD